ncbi:MAG: hypothetical protein ABIP77_07230 [Candidatus Limnocylindrales bacterium]
MSTPATRTAGEGRIRLAARVTIDAGYHVVGSYLEKNSPYVCEGAISPQLTDAVVFDLLPSNSGGFAIGGIKNSVTKFKPPKFPVPVPEATVTLATQQETKGADPAPELFDLESGSGELQVSANLMTVLLTGTIYVGACTFKDVHGQYKGEPYEDDVQVTMSFHVDGFRSGSVIGKPDSRAPWAWIVTEQ